MASPYYLFGAQRRYPYAWHGGAGGVPQSRVAAETRELSGADLIESGLSPYAIPYPALRKTVMHDPLKGLGDWPLPRPSGPEPQDPIDLGDLFDLSRNEKLLALGAAAGITAFVLWRRRRRRR